jgi:hypothetical protein
VVVAVEQAGLDASGVVQREAAKASEAAGAMVQSTTDALQNGADTARSLGLPPSVLRRREMRDKRDLLQAGQQEEDRLVAEQVGGQEGRLWPVPVDKQTCERSQSKHGCPKQVGMNLPQ